MARKRKRKSLKSLTDVDIEPLDNLVEEPREQKELKKLGDVEDEELTDFRLKL